MTVRFPCPNCRHKLKAAEAERGKRARCTKCGTVFRVPLSDDGAGVAGVERSEPPVITSSRGLATLDPGHPSPTDEGWLPVDEPPMLRTVPSQDDEIDMTPMIDVVFQLLIFFMVTSTFALQKALPIPTPEASEGVAQNTTLDDVNPDDVLIVRVDADDAIWVDDVLAVSRPDLIAKMKQARLTKGPGGEQGRRRLLVQADPDAHHEAVVLALDAGSAAGMEDVRLATDEESF
jgi:biopolymer transport protein ExbD